jgi:DNA polymerase I-like protein with 3'-5' exonuclease and polymerase domains
MKAPLICDIETVGDPFSGKVVTLGWRQLHEPRGHVEAVGHLERAVPYPDDLLEMMADPRRPFVSFTKYDARFLRLSGVEVTGPFYDIQDMCYLDNENQSLSLERTAWRYLHLEMDKRIKVRKRQVFFTCDDGQLVPIDEAPLDQLYKYNMGDVDAEHDLFDEMWERLASGGWLDYFLEERVPFTAVLVNVECRGLPVDLERTAQFTKEMEAEHARFHGELYAEAELPETFNINSPDQMASYLYHKTFELTDQLPIPVDVQECARQSTRKAFVCRAEHTDRAQCKSFQPPDGFTVDKLARTYAHGRWTLRGRGLRPSVKTDSGKWSVSRPALKVNYHTAADPWVQKLLEYRSIDKLLTTYLRVFPERAVNGRIYGRFNSTGTKTGRLSSSEPNLQNIPSHGELGPRTRDLFRPRGVAA